MRLYLTDQYTPNRYEDRKEEEDEFPQNKHLATHWAGISLTVMGLRLSIVGM